MLNYLAFTQLMDANIIVGNLAKLGSYGWSAFSIVLAVLGMYLPKIRGLWMISRYLCIQNFKLEVSQKKKKLEDLSYHFLNNKKFRWFILSIDMRIKSFVKVM